MAELPRERLREVAVTGELSPNCVICNGGQTKQHLLPCLHSYGLCRRPECRAVVERASVTCTACQSGFRGIRATVHHFATRLLKEEVVGGPYCWQCEKRGHGIKAAVCYCAHVSCFSYLCEECHDSHATNPGTENHAVELLGRLREDLRERNITPWLRSKDLFCETHGKELGRYCQNCEDLICSHCSEVEPHRSHRDISDISQELCEEMREQMRTSGDRIAGQLQKVVRAQERVEQRIAAVKTNAREAQQQINEDCDAMQAQIRVRRDQLLEEVDQSCQEKTTALSRQREELTTAVAQMRGFAGNVHRVVSKGSVEDHFTLKGTANQRSAQLERHMRTLSLEPVRDDCVAYFNKGSAKVQGVIRTMGVIQDHTSKSGIVLFEYFINKYFHRSHPYEER